MCSFLVQIVYGVLCLAAVAMTITAMVTPGWTTFSVNTQDFTQGIFPFTCAWPGDDVTPNPIFNFSDCTVWFNNLPWTEKMVVVCMCIGLAFQALAFVWNIISICACCCKKYILHPLSFFTFFAVIFLAIAVIAYAIWSPGYLELSDMWADGLNTKSVGFSFWLACGALGLNVINLVVASAALCCAKSCC
ncbi:hypothetical protein PFISCL1PPCAC_22686 [Pristionchus fissidentatus]|uniref:Uncharacterized protein n=1 Tax=Pristionchus fissidentatus TaxID=1538716 RepID=A0AAV5WNQ4_9BILA|nr:hypothetical protein PFISCL1PPCAC_22686 [Pristionchus fissidentatus]